MEAVLDHAMLDKLQKYLYSHGLTQMYKNLAYCGTGGYLSGAGGNPFTHVAVLSNGSHAKLTGLKVCRNLWGCPVCASIGLAKQAAKVKTIIEEFAKCDIVPFMLTITIPHRKKMPAKQVLTTIKTLQREMFSLMFHKNGRKLMASVRHYGKISFWETTYGEHGWHFHSHNLVFVHKDDFDTLNDCYPYWKEMYRKKLIKLDLRPENFKMKHSGFHCSVNPDGKIRQHDSVAYLTAELTSGNTKDVRKDGNRNVWDLLRSGTDEDMKLFLEYVEATRYVQKVSYSRSMLKILGLTQEQFDNLRLTDIKKVYRPVCIFTPESWINICRSDIINGTRHRIKILQLAVYFDFEGICKYCIENNILPPRRPSDDELQRFEDFINHRAA